MKPVTRLQQYLPPLYGWSAYHEEWKVAFHSHALVTTAGVALVDPLKPVAGVLSQLADLGEPWGVFLTGGNHARDADWFRREYGIQVYAHPSAATDGDIKIDVPVLDGEKLPGGLQAVQLPGHGVGEMAWLAQQEDGILFLGDALLHPSADKLEYLPPNYCEDLGQAAQSLKKLNSLSFAAATFAHGEPIVAHAKQQITEFLKHEKRKS